MPLGIAETVFIKHCDSAEERQNHTFMYCLPEIQQPYCQGCQSSARNEYFSLNLISILGQVVVAEEDKFIKRCMVNMNFRDCLVYFDDKVVFTQRN